MQKCFRICERQDTYLRRGELLRVALSAPCPMFHRLTAGDLEIFEGWFCGVLGLVLFFVCFWVFVCLFFCLFVCLFVCLGFPHGSEINTVVCEVVCEVEGPSELSWRARHGRKKSLPALAGCGWTVLAAALLGTSTKPAVWTEDGFRPVIGTTIDSKVVPSPISGKEESLLLSRWWPARETSLRCEASTFLQGYEIKHSPSQAHVSRRLQLHQMPLLVFSGH